MAKNCCKYFTVSLVPVASLTLAVLFGLAIVALPVLYVELAKEYRYGVIIDAGSGHTSMYFYRWKTPRYRHTADLEELDHCDTDESINSYASNASDAGLPIQKCLDKSRKRGTIPKSQRSRTQLYLGATAGMRLIRCQNETLSEEIMVSVNSTLNNSEYNLVSGRIISGQEEAVSGWITGNSLARNFRHFDDDSSFTGALDLGGASTQITFLHDSTSDPHYQTNITLYDRNYALYARSYLCYGLNEARSRFLAHLINSTAQNGSQPIPNPCMLVGAVITYQADDIYSSECVRQTCSSSGVFASGFSPPKTWELGEEENYTFNGTGNPTECSRIIREVFDLTDCYRSGVCVGSKYFWPPVNNSGTFLGMSAYYGIARFFNQSNVELTNLTKFNANVGNFCKLSNKTASRRYPGDKYLQVNCFDGSFTLFLLMTGFGFNGSDSGWTLKFVNKVDGKSSVGWATGYLLQQTTSIPDSPHHTERPFGLVDLAVGILVLAILCIVFIVFFFLTCYACRKVLWTRGGYNNI